MNVFATLKTVFFGSKFLSAPVPSDGTPRRDFVSALNGLMPLCRTIPGVHLAVDIREGRVALVLNWTSRTDGNALAGVYHYIVSDEDGVKEVSKSQVLPAENGKGNLPESRNEAPGCSAVLIEKTEEESAQSGSARKVMNIAHSKDIEKEAGLVPSKEAVKKAKSCSLMQEVTAFLTSRYRFRFNVLTEETEVAEVTNNIPDTHLRYTKVDERWMNTLSMEVWKKALDNVTPQLEVKSRRIGGATFQVPTEIRPERKESISMKNLIAFARKRGGKSMADKLAAEILDAYNEQGGAFKRKEDMHRMAEANRAFAHFRF